MRIHARARHVGDQNADVEVRASRNLRKRRPGPEIAIGYRKKELCSTPQKKGNEGAKTGCVMRIWERAINDGRMFSEQGNPMHSLDGNA